MRKIDEERLHKLREKRKLIADARINQKKINEYGVSVVSEITSALNIKLSIDDFDPNIVLPFKFKWERSIDDCDGVVAAYVSKNKLVDILSCCYEITGELSGLIGVNGCLNLGFSAVPKVNILKLVTIAENLNDSVLFYPNEIKGVLLIDHYEIRGTRESKDFSLVIQGNELEEKLMGCF